ncbi:BTAD domain-containing putative transcriptional regulator [Streptomyces sp. PRh5]|uniref:AfsR/SARP family transcriptional regulator n=1 Tax=Streptomyces sp. PRh5 TaxID=1158056 RepID=UPI000995E4C7|nr:BTAD domain-containing putative transcriptional regulator [Streptomyces sp. PRh5]
MISFRVLGALEITSAIGHVITLRGVNARRLLGVLLLTPGEWVSDERLIELAWSPMGASRAALHNAVSRLRGWLHTSVDCSVALEYSAARYRIKVPPESVDVVRFRSQLADAEHARSRQERADHLLAALGEWRGPVLAHTREWIRTDPEVVNLEKSRLDSTCELADIALQTGGIEQALPYVERMAGALPYDEPLQARLITMLGACGRRAEALRVYEEVRAGLAEELGVDPSAELRDVHLRLLRGDYLTEPTPCGEGGETTLAFAAAAPKATPAMLPRDIADFAGREEETRQIGRFLRVSQLRKRVDVLVVSGKLGVGKTALAIHAGHMHKDAFPDGQLFVDLRGTGPEPLPPGAVLAQFLRALGVDTSHLPADLGERAALYRTHLSGRRVLVVLDNALDETQVRPLLPGSAGCTVLVTSRYRLLSLEGTRRLTLDVPTRHEAFALLANVMGRQRVTAEPEAARTVIDVCGRLPLAVRAAGQRLAARPHRNLAWMVEQLSDERRRIGELDVDDVALRTHLALSYEALGGEECALFRWAALLATSDFTASTAAELIGRSVEHTERLLDRLVQANLLEVCPLAQETEAKYHFHELIRCYARERAVVDSVGTVTGESALVGRGQPPMGHALASTPHCSHVEGRTLEA